MGIDESLDEAGSIARPLMLHLAGADEVLSAHQQLGAGNADEKANGMTN